MFDKIEIELKRNFSWNDLLNRLIEIHGVSAELLCEGLCSPGMLSKIRKGERRPNKMMRDRLMERLGVTDGRNECFLHYDEFAKWEQSQNILKRIISEDYTEALDLLENFTKEKDFKHKLEQQFYHAMLAQVYLCRHTHEQEIGTLFEQAVKLSVPDIDTKPIQEMILAPQELNLILEYAYYRKKESSIRYTEDVIAYINQANMGEQMRAKIYPKAIYYDCRAKKALSNPNYQKMLQQCNLAIECLRNAGKMYYFWELLEMRSWIYAKFMDDYKEDEKKKAIFEKLNQENAKWKKAIEDVYERCKISPQMKNDTYLYFQMEMYCMNDVIRVRREMLGMTKKELCEGICDEQTMGRLENRKSKVQLAIAKKLFEKLGLSGEFQRTEIVSNDPQCLRLEEQLTNAINNFEIEEAKEILNELEKSLPMELFINKQYVKHTDAILRWRSGELTGTEAMQQIKEALNDTIEYKYIDSRKELYLTNGELTCIHNMAIIMGNQTLNEYHMLLKGIYETYEKNDKVQEHLTMYEMVMPAIASTLGNMGEYDASDRCMEKVLLAVVRNRRLRRADRCLYSFAWNNKERRKKGELLPQGWSFREDLDRCIVLSGITKNTYYEQGYQKMMD